MRLLYPGKSARKPYDKWELVTCPSCKALLWNAEAIRGQSNQESKQFSLCCQKGRVRLPPVREPPSPLLELLESPSFKPHIRAANSLLDFTSMGANVDSSVTGTPGPFTFRVHGQIIHRIGSMLPEDGNDPEYLQLYIFDTENELRNRKRALTDGSSSLAVDDNIIIQLIEIRSSAISDPMFTKKKKNTKKTTFFAGTVVHLVFNSFDLGRSIDSKTLLFLFLRCRTNMCYLTILRFQFCTKLHNKHTQKSNNWFKLYLFYFV